MIYVLDTDILSLLAHQNSPEAPRIRRHIVELSAEDHVVTTVITYEEQMRGWMAALRQIKSSASEVPVYARLLQHLETFRRITVLANSRVLRGNRCRLFCGPRVVAKQKGCRSRNPRGWSARRLGSALI